jgi:predicted alpha/beta-fold hydrolase
MIRAGFPDWPLMVLSSKPEFAQIGFRYGRAFRPLVLPGAGGEPIAALVALRPTAPAVVIVHGAMTTKHFDYVRRLATRLHDAGFSAVAIDQRGFGGTALASAAPNSLGFHEGEDIVAIAGWLRSRGATSVGAAGFSLGGAAVLSAARVSSERPGGLDGGALALSPPADMAAVTARASRRPGVRDRFFPTWLTLEAAATGRARAVGFGHGRVTPAQAVERFAAPWYGVDVATFYGRASAVGFIDRVTVPTLILHAEDDVVVPVAQARLLRDAAAGNPAVRVLVLPAGGHTAFDAVDPRWMHAVELAWFGSLARFS